MMNTLEQTSCLDGLRVQAIKAYASDRAVNATPLPPIMIYEYIAIISELFVN